MKSPDFLLLSQRKHLLLNIQQAQLEPSEFEWRDILHQNIDASATLFHKSSGYYFKLTVNKLTKGIYCTYSPGDEFIVEGPKSGDWNQILLYHYEWLQNLILETNTPDVWSMLSMSNELTESIDLINDTDSFTEEEQKRLSQGISEIKHFLIDTNELNSQQLKFIESRLSHLEESSKRLSKKDWILTAVGILTSIIIQVCLSPENSRELFLIASTAFSWIQQGYLTLPDF